MERHIITLACLIGYGAFFYWAGYCDAKKVRYKMKIRFLSKNPLTIRQHYTRLAAAIFLMPIIYVTQFFTGSPGPNWLLAYAKQFEKLAGKEGFTWS